MLAKFLHRASTLVDTRIDESALIETRRTNVPSGVAALVIFQACEFSLAVTVNCTEDSSADLSLPPRTNDARQAFEDLFKK